ncbi:putative short-chain dehydrogenase [Colletotrichum sp. SAR 10_99]|nr:putative short-chain dehydrogenase [Colletotrichum sp. SAR 10_96]KAI8293678.1 putative short-chain dehydrogenase [Colletotrichum sp. SAR 10_98]KAJ5017473.1 putative short-chain dehydrogenase [Colletotrichum sp. SAR 10_99]
MSHYAAAQQNPQGPGDARPTALRIIEDENLVGKLAGKTIFITGANQGIGLHTARALYATGADIFLGVRSNEKGNKAIADIENTPNLLGRGSLQVVVLSLDSLDSVRKGAESFLAKSGGKLNILINNAGVIQHEKTKTIDGLEAHFGINHIGHFLLFQLLRPALLASVTPEFHSRVVAVSSMAHRASEIRFHDFNFEEEDSFVQSVAYGHSKTANIYFSNEVERRFGSQGLHSLSLHPGSIMTNMSATQPIDVEAAKAAMGEELFNKMMSILKNLAQGAATTVYAAVSKEWEGRGGKYLSDCVEASPTSAGYNMMSTDTGYASWAYDEAKATLLWKESCKLVGVEEE